MRKVSFRRFPATIVDRALWLQGHNLERMIVGSLREFDDVFGLVRLLLNDVEATDHAPAPHKLAGDLFALAIERPELLATLLFRSRGSPVLLADLLLYPGTSALASLLISQWQSSPGAWERELTTRDDHTTKMIAFADAVSIMGSFLEAGTLRSEEVGSLVNWLHRTAQPGFIDELGNDEVMLGAVRSELVRQSPETLSAMVSGLMTAGQCLGTSSFAAVLDIIDVGGLSGKVDAKAIVSAYSRSVATGGYTLSAGRVSASAAGSLFEMASVAPELRKEFLYPLNRLVAKSRVVFLTL